MSLSGNKNGNRRTANIRSVGYSDLFVLSKDDLWDALKEYPEAKRALIETGRKMLMKDNLLDPEIAKKQDMNVETTEDKVARLENALDAVQTRLGRLLGEYNSMQAKLKQRITKLERVIHKDDPDNMDIEDIDDDLPVDLPVQSDINLSKITVEPATKSDDNTDNDDTNEEDKVIVITPTKKQSMSDEQGAKLDTNRK